MNETKNTRTIAFPYEAASKEHDGANICGSLDAMGDVIKKYRKEAGLTQAELAGEMDVQRNTVVAWEANRSHPPLEILIKLSHRLSIPITELFHVGMATADMTIKEKRVFDDYRKLDAYDQKMVSQMIRLFVSEAQDRKAAELENDYRPIGTLATPAAAGTGCDYLDSSTFEIRFFKKNPRFASADVVCRVCGHSMEPFYRDGDLVYAKTASDADDGDDVICDSNDGQIIKRKYGNTFMSLNTDPKYAVHKSPYDHVHIVAVVLGIVPDEDRVDETIVPELADIHFEEVSELKTRLHMI